MYYCEFTDTLVTVKNEDGRLIRRLSPDIRTPGGKIVGAQVSGDYVTIQSNAGKAVVYNIEGRLIRGHL